MTVFIVPDTNVLYTDPFLEGPLVRTILASESRTNIRLVIPEIVVDELRGHVEQELKKTVDDADRIRRDYVRLRGSSPYSVNLLIDPEQRQAVMDRFDRRAQQLVSEDRILGYPSVSTKELAQRSIAHHVPFQDRDRGLRDTLIWLTVKEYLFDAKGTGTNVALVTNDKVFWDPSKSKLNESLARELVHAGVPLDSLDIHSDFQNIISAFVSANLSSVEWVTTAIEGGKIADYAAVNDAVLLEVTEWVLRNSEIFEEPRGPITGYLYIEFDLIEEVSLERIEQTLDLSCDEVLVDSKWTGHAVVQGYEHRYFSDSLSVSLEFALSSIVEPTNDGFRVRSHEITDVAAVDFVRYDTVHESDLSDV